MLNKMLKKNAVIFTVLLIQASAFAEEIPPIDCMIEPNQMIEVSSPVEGVLDTLLVDRSDEVKQGQVLATIKSDVEQVKVKMSQERLKLSQVENKRAVGLYRKKVISLTERDKLENEMKLFELDLENAKVNLALRQIKSPVDGVVVKRYFSPGEFVESRPIIKLAQLEPLKIEVVSLVSNYGKIIKGMRARIVPEHGDYPELVADVVVVDKVIDAASGTFGVRLALPNKDHAIPSGLKCKVHFLPRDTAADNTDTVNERSELTTSVEVAAVTSADDDSFSSTAPSINNDLMCSTIGPYKNRSELNTLIAELQPDINHTDLRTETEIKTTYIVVSNAFNSSREARSAMRLMKAAGVTDMAKIRRGGKHRIALGEYSEKTSAINRVNALRNKGYEVQMKPRHRMLKTYWSDITHSPALADTLTTLVPSAYKKSCNEAVPATALSENNDLMCSTIGPYKNRSELNILIAGLQPDINHTGLRTETEEKTNYIVVSDGFNTLQQASSAMRQMKAAGVTDIAMVYRGGKHRIALGVYSDRLSAINRVNTLAKKGYQVHMKPRHRMVKVQNYWADITYPPALEDRLTTLIPASYKKSCDESIKLSLLNNE